MWLMNGSGLRQGVSRPGGAILEWVIQGVGDVNGDGYADFIWRHQNTGSTAVWLMNGSGARQGVSRPGGAILEWVIQGVGDVNGDGYADFIWRHQNTGSTAVWLMNGSGLRQGVLRPGEQGIEVALVGVGDVNGDNRHDFVWRNAATGATSGWLMDGSPSPKQVPIPGGAGLNWQDYRVTLTMRSEDTGSLGVMLRYQDPENYYRFSWDAERKFRRLIKVANGVFQLLAQDTVPYETGQSYEIEALLFGNSIQIRIDGELLFGGPVQDQSDPLTRGTIALYSWNNAGSVFDNVKVDVQRELTIFSPSNGAFFVPPSLGLSSSVELTAQASATGFPANWGVQFVPDGDDDNAFEDFLPPYEWQSSWTRAEHTIKVYMVDDRGIRQENFSDASSFVVGDYYVAFGDSITLGVDDDDSTDDTSKDGRNSGGGYPPILNNLLTHKKSFPHTIENEGTGGDTSNDGVAKIGSRLSAHPMSQRFLVMFGTNDSSGALPRSSGLGLSQGQGGYSGSFKDRMNRIVSAIIADGKIPVLAYVPIRFGGSSSSNPYSNPDSHPANLLIQDYNKVIDELRAIHPEIQGTPPDFFEYFSQTPRANGISVEFDDNLHPNGEGYRSMAELWAEVLSN